MKIHKEGHGLLLKVLAITIAAVWGSFKFLGHLPIAAYLISATFIAFFLIILQFFRYPIRKLTKGDNLVIAPADGKVVVIEEVEEPEYFQGKRRQVSIFMSPINVHVNRNPIAGMVKYFKYHPGKYLVAWHPKSSTENERTTTVVQHKNGTEVLYRQIAGALAKRICWYIKEGDQVDQAEDFGFIKFGSRVDIFLPLDAKINVELNQVSKGGVTVLAEFA